MSIAQQWAPGQIEFLMQVKSGVVTISKERLPNLAQVMIDYVSPVKDEVVLPSVIGWKLTPQGEAQVAAILSLPVMKQVFVNPQTGEVYE